MSGCFCIYLMYIKAIKNRECGLLSLSFFYVSFPSFFCPHFTSFLFLCTFFLVVFLLILAFILALLIVLLENVFFLNFLCGVNLSEVAFIFGAGYRK